MITSTRLAALAAVLALLTPTLRAQVPQFMNYQGRVTVGSTNFDGTGQFKFALVNDTGTTTYWSNNGSSVAGSEPTNAISLPVTKGLYAVALGESGTSLPASVFNNPDVRLRVWFNDGTNGSQRLAPDQAIGMVGYAARASSSALIAGQRIVRGSIGGDGAILQGTGFTVAFLPPGSNGTVLPGHVNVTSGSTTVTATASESPQFTTQLQAGQYVAIGGSFYRVASIQSNTSMTLDRNYGGSTATGVNLTKNMQLFPRYTVTLNPILGGATVTLATHGSSLSNGGADAAFNVITLDDAVNTGSDHFSVMIAQWPFGAYLPGPSVGWEFIAIGQ